MKFVFSALIATFAGVSLAVQQPQLPENIVQAIRNLSADENYQLIEQYAAIATPQELIALDLRLENRQQEIQGIKTIRNCVVVVALWVPVVFTSIKALVYKYTTESTLESMHCSFMSYNFTSVLVVGGYLYWGYNEQLERIAQLRYSIKVAAVE